jgi:hypothetical protein
VCVGITSVACASFWPVQSFFVLFLSTRWSQGSTHTHTHTHTLKCMRALTHAHTHGHAYTYTTNTSRICRALPTLCFLHQGSLPSPPLTLVRADLTFFVRPGQSRRHTLRNCVYRFLSPGSNDFVFKRRPVHDLRF